MKRMLKNGQAKVIKRCPFTIHLLYNTTNYIQPVHLGIDAGSRNTGVCATTEKKELYCADVELRKDIEGLLSTHRENWEQEEIEKQDTIKRKYPDVFMTYGYITKNTRIKNNLPKEHYVDVRCISRNPLAKLLGYYYLQKKILRHNRQIHKSNILKGGIRKRNQAEYLVKGYRLFDKVSYNGNSYFIFGWRKSGFFDIRNLNVEKVNKVSINCKKIKLAEKAKRYLIEIRKQVVWEYAISPAISPPKGSGFLAGLL